MLLRATSRRPIAIDATISQPAQFIEDCFNPRPILSHCLQIRATVRPSVRLPQPIQTLYAIDRRIEILVQLPAERVCARFGLLLLAADLEGLDEVVPGWDPLYAVVDGGELVLAGWYDAQVEYAHGCVVVSRCGRSSG